MEVFDYRLSINPDLKQPLKGAQDSELKLINASSQNSTDQNYCAKDVTQRIVASSSLSEITLCPIVAS